MHSRKLIGFGKSSLVVSLPKSWLSHNKLSKGNVVYLEELDDQLVITAQEVQKEKELHTLHINTDGKSVQEIKSEILSGYLRNYHIWELRGKNIAEHGPKIKSFLQNLSGLELMEQDAYKIIAKDLMDTHELSVEALLRRIDLIIRSMMQDSTAATDDYYDSIFSRDVDVNRLVYLVKRVISSGLSDHHIAKKLGRSARQLMIDMRTAGLLEYIGDEVKRISRFLKSIDKKQKFYKEFKAMNEELQEKYLLAMKAYHKDNQRVAIQLEQEHKERMERIDAIAKTTTSHTAQRCLHHMKALNSHIKNIARMVLS